MTDAPVQLYVNPTAGRGRAGKRLVRIEELLDEAGVTIQTHLSDAVGDLERQVKAAVDRGASRVIVAGGDGSIHEAVNGIMAAAGTAKLGVIPTGTGNDFAKACNIPLDWEHATRLLGDRIVADSAWRRIDVGRMNERYFANGVGIGFDAKVTKVARSYRWPIGDLVYLLALFQCIVDGVITPALTITADELTRSGPTTLVNVSNGAWVGGMFHIAPMADNSDGRLELLVADPVSRLRTLGLLPKILSGTHVGEKEVSHVSVRRVTIEAAEPVPSHLDGEVMPLLKRFEIELLPAALDLL
ncbi:MAG: diacylglycerol kinase family lipid kinase [Woeseiaceae bacterium]|nr:diacylglycerol kinase family lipid kinase [Woeseiaceae bacterium]